MQEIPEIVSGTVSGLAFGGSGIVRQEGLVIFIPFTAPGDEITFRITEKRKKYAFGELIKVNVPSEERVTPRCPYFRTCGGCQLQHLSYNAQLAHKQEVVKDSLERIGRVELPTSFPVRPSSEQWAYRRHATLTLRPKAAGGFDAGYIGLDDHLLVSVKQCPIFIEEEDPLIEHLQELVGKLQSNSSNSGKVTILKQTSGGPILDFRFDAMPGKCAPLFEHAMQEYGWAGVHVIGGKEELSWGALTTQWHFDGLSFSLSPQAFSQANPYQADHLYLKICELAAQSKGVRILDLYSGVGISSILLARQGAKVLGIESNPIAVQLARKNSQENDVSNVTFIQEDARTAVYGALKQFTPDLIVVNPTRNGLDLLVAHALITELPKQIIYISCMPPTLARDLRLLRARDYTIKSCEMLDMFPQTAHVETIAHLVR